MSSISGGFTKVGESLFGGKRSTAFAVLLNVVIIIFSLVLVFEVLFNTFFLGIYVVNVSMQPTLNGAEREGVSGGDYIYVNKYAEPERGDIVVVYREAQASDGSTLKGNIIKRVIALGGDTVKIERGILYLNGEAQDESYLDFDRIDMPNSNFAEHRVAEGCMFLLGDNRDNSTDSRQSGDYPLSCLVGVVTDWSLNTKSCSTAIYNFFNYTVYGK